VIAAIVLATLRTVGIDILAAFFVLTFAVFLIAAFMAGWRRAGRDLSRLRSSRRQP
jgi:hypothetical protein